MENTGCVTCGKSKANLVCGSCSCSVCKYCAQIIDEGTFSFLPKIPATLSHQVYCSSCFDKDVAVELQNYNDTMERAKNVQVFFKAQYKEIIYVKRPERKPIRIIDCADQQETIMRMAFQAAHANYNALLDVEVSYEKVRQNSYQTHKWMGTGVPANVEDRMLVKDRSFSSNPN